MKIGFGKYKVTKLLPATKKKRKTKQNLDIMQIIKELHLNLNFMRI